MEKQLGAITSGQYVAQIVKTQISETDGVMSFQFHTDWAAYQRLKRRRLGKRILCTDNQSWSDQDIILASRAQHHVERAFKQMKNPHWVSFSPAFHWTDQKLRVHVFYCVLALLLSSLLQRKAAHGGHPLTIEKLLAELSGVTELVNLYTRRPRRPPEGATGLNTYSLNARPCKTSCAGYLTYTSTSMRRSAAPSVYTSRLRQSSL